MKHDDNVGFAHDDEKALCNRLTVGGNSLEFGEL